MKIDPRRFFDVESANHIKSPNIFHLSDSVVGGVQKGQMGCNFNGAWGWVINLSKKKIIDEIR